MKATCYDVLLLKRHASEAEIRSAYRKLAARFHPDRDPSAAQDRFLVINKAYLTLSDPDKRRDYDRSLPEEGPRTTIGDKIEAALRGGVRRRPPARPAKPTPREKFWVRPLKKSLPYGHFSEWARKKLRKEFGVDVRRSFWEPRDMAATKFVRTWIEPYGFQIRPEVVVDLEKKFDDLPKAFFMDAGGHGAPRIWGKHRAVAAANRGVRITVYVRVS